ncbi:sensor histidine kinase [Actinocorallia sp. A-T 12471]|uniref:sensor histidine kinase n=1 Tax=Actinocorallia sp. A-T 12471 TaxID=3089813 RepID=UPI0029D17D7A|nr:sensor histidine kinase [Actinocorallia sp. A-T 12471]MDX6741319.1 sensor histidine kinase [Actinocorallia sp. A-T 12471]
MSESAKRRHRAVTWALGLCGLAYPVVLPLALSSGRRGFDEAEVLPAAILTVASLALVRRAPLTGLFFLTAAWTAAFAEMPKVEVAILFALLVDGALVYVALAKPRPVSLTAVAAVLLVQTGVLTVHLGGTPADLPMLIALALLTAGLAWSAGASLRQSRLHARELAERSAAEAVAAERLRIARDLHDMVAHSIGVIAIQAGVGGRVIDTQPAEARNALAAIEETSRETLAGLRRMLGALRRADQDDAPTPGLAGLDRLISTTGAAGVRVELRRTGERRTLPAEVDLAAFRIVQEAVANVVRHARTDRCEVALDYGRDELVVAIADEGEGPSGDGAGYGLLGMRERAGLLGGDLTAGPGPDGGFRVSARLPLAGAAR